MTVSLPITELELRLRKGLKEAILSEWKANAVAGHPHEEWAEIAARVALASERERSARLSSELEAISDAIGSTRFMDPPDGGDVSLAEQVGRMRAALTAAEAQVAGLRAALKPFADLSQAMDASAVAGQRKLQPEECAGVSDAEIASLVHPDTDTVASDGVMAFGKGLPADYVRRRITVADLRRARALTNGDVDV